jgi:hypothetical protein
VADCFSDSAALAAACLAASATNRVLRRTSDSVALRWAWRDASSSFGFLLEVIRPILILEQKKNVEIIYDLSHFFKYLQFFSLESPTRVLMLAPV